MNAYEQMISDKVREIADELVQQGMDITASNVTLLLINRVFPEMLQKGKMTGPRFNERYDELFPTVERILAGSTEGAT